MFEDMEKNEFELAEEEDRKEEAKKAKKSKKTQALDKEYDDSFDGEEKMMHKLSNVKSEITFIQKEIEIDSIITSEFKKLGRKDSISGLTGIVAEWGVVSPIHVLALEDDDCYQLLDGLRRVFAALRNGKETIKAIIWDFSDKREGKELANIISLMINRNQEYTPKEMWEQMKILESVNEATPGLVEYLLQMNPGDAMKLKDVMLADASYSAFRDDLISGKYTIEQAYKKLCNERKKEDKLEKEDKMSVDSEGIKDSGSSDTNESSRLSSSEVKELLEMEGSSQNNSSGSDDDLDEDSLDALNKTDEIREDDMHQKVGERHMVDSALKKAVLIRDENKCRCCGIGGPQWAGILVFHHLVPVFAGGPDTEENGLTLCVNCHLTLHNYVNGDIHVREEDLDESQLETFKNIFKYGNVAIEASKKMGMKRKEIREANKSSLKHPMPNANVKINKAALLEAGKLHNQGNEEVDSEENFDNEDFHIDIDNMEI